MVRIISVNNGKSIFAYIANWKNPYMEQVIRNITYKEIIHDFKYNIPLKIYDI